MYGRVVELVDTLDSKSCELYAREGSSPSSPTKFKTQAFSLGFKLGGVTINLNPKGRELPVVVQAFLLGVCSIEQIFAAGA